MQVTDRGLVGDNPCVTDRGEALTDRGEPRPLTPINNGPSRRSTPLSHSIGRRSRPGTLVHGRGATPVQVTQQNKT